MTLQKELLELSAKVETHLGIYSISEIQKPIELSDDIKLPYTFTVEALHPGIFKGVTLLREEIINAKDTIFYQEGNFSNDEINKDHKGNRKMNSSVDDLIGKVTVSDYDINKDAYVLKGEIYDMGIALRIKNNLLKYVSLRINPEYIEEIAGQKIARGLRFEELSFVRAPGDSNVKIIDKD